MSNIQSFHVFLSYNSKNKPAVIELARRLKARGLKVWLDEWELLPGRPWQEALERIIETTRAAAVLVGEDGIGPWEDAEMQACLDEFARRDLAVVPVLLPGCPDKPKLPLLLRRFTWVDFRNEREDEAFLRLVWGITGEKPKELHEAHGFVPRDAEPSVGVGRPAIIQRPALPEAPFIHGWPADKVQALQKRAAESQGRPVFFCHRLKSGGEGPEMVVIPAGAFDMGSNDGDNNEKPVHRVTLAGFAIGRFPVTVADYARFRAVPAGNENDAHPVVNVSWQEAQEYCAWLSRETNRVYRLPSEAEWEYACRAGTAGRWYWGDDEGGIGRHAWYRSNAGGGTHPAGEKQSNAFDLYDMLGNVWEWCEDVWHGDYRGAPADGNASLEGGDRERRVARGGSWHDGSDLIWSARRNGYNPSDRGKFLGFRVVELKVLPGAS